MRRSLEIIEKALEQGVVLYAAIVVVAWGVAREPFSAARLLVLHAASLAATLAALHRHGAFAVLLAAPLAGLAAYRLLRRARE
jgi:hypothetical protein